MEMCLMSILFEIRRVLCCLFIYFKINSPNQLFIRKIRNKLSRGQFYHELMGQFIHNITQIYFFNFVATSLYILKQRHLTFQSNTGLSIYLNSFPRYFISVLKFPFFPLCHFQIPRVSKF